jgi:type IV secretory pathway VirB2 component (pilin)
LPEIKKKIVRNKIDPAQVKAIAALLFSALLFVAIPLAIVHADNGSAICTVQANSDTDIGTCINRIYVISLAAGGFIAVVLIIVAGYLYMTGGKSVETAKNIIYSVVSGLVILFGAYALLNTINPDLTTFGALSLPALTCNGTTGTDTGKYLCGTATANLISNGSGTAGTTGTSSGTFVIDGYDLSSYSTSSIFAGNVTSVLSKTQQANLSSASSIDAFMAAEVQGGPTPKAPLQITGQMVLNSATNYGVDKNMILTLMWVESANGTSSTIDINTHNPGSVGNNDAGQTINDFTWQDGVDALAQWLSNHEVQ